MGEIFITPQNVGGFNANNTSVFAETNSPITTSSNHPNYLTESIPATMRRTAGRFLGVGANGIQSLAHSSPPVGSSNDPAHLAEAFRVATKQF